MPSFVLNCCYLSSRVEACTSPPSAPTHLVDPTVLSRRTQEACGYAYRAQFGQFQRLIPRGTPGLREDGISFVYGFFQRRRVPIPGVGQAEPLAGSQLAAFSFQL